LGEATTRNVGTFGVDANGKATSGMNHKGERTDATPRDGAPRSSDEVCESGQSEGGACSEAQFVGPTRNGRSPKDEAKPYCISRREVLEAYRKVKSNKGAAGVELKRLGSIVGTLFSSDLLKSRDSVGILGIGWLQIVCSVKPMPPIDRSHVRMQCPG
jgi:hypothetical protein